jgi:hypothetical protein
MDFDDSMFVGKALFCNYPVYKCVPSTDINGNWPIYQVWIDDDGEIFILTVGYYFGPLNAGYVWEPYR